MDLSMGHVLSYQEHKDASVPLDIVNEGQVCLENYSMKFKFVSDKKSLCEILNISSEAEAGQWLRHYSDHTKTTWRRKERQYPSSNTVAYRERLRCHHNTRSQKLTGKNTKCPAWIKLILMKKYEEIPAHLVVEFHYTHNHDTTSAAALSKRDVSDETKNKLLDLFSLGYGASEALSVLKYSLLDSTNPADHHLVLADRSIVPDVFYVCRLHSTVITENYGKVDNSIETIKNNSLQMITRLKEKNGVKALHEDVDGDFVISVVSPVMQRAHKLRESSHLCFLDATSNCDRNQCKVFFMMTATRAGGVPLGVFIATSQTSELISCGLRHIAQLMGNEAFGGRGKQGPIYMMTDDCNAEARAIKTVWPECRRLLCTFHIGQATWRWLRDTKNGVPEIERQPLMRSFQSLVYTKSKNSLEARFQDLLEHAPAKFIDYIKDLMARQEEWAHAFRQDKIITHHTNNVVESAFKVLKEYILHRMRAFNIAHLLEFVCVRMESSYSSRFIAASCGTLVQRIAAPKTNIKKIDEDTYKLDHHQIKISIKECISCGEKQQCQAIEACLEQVSLADINQLSLSERKLLYWLGAGIECQESTWFKSLHATTGEEAAAVSSVPELQGNTSDTNDSAGYFESACAADNPSKEQFIERKQKLLAVLNGKCEQFGYQKDVYDGMDAIMKSLLKIHTSSSLTSFFRTAGKSFLTRRRIIPVQPTAVARRRRGLPRGSSAVQSGRPRNLKRVSEHGYAQNPFDVKRRRPAPHCLGHAIDKNISLGKKH